LSCHYEKSGIFSVRSAYKHALNEKLSNDESNNISNTNGYRMIWKNIWDANVPPKVRVFMWKSATETLSVQENRRKRLPNQIPTCNICGMGVENGYHMVMNCTPARALRYELRKLWDLPPDNALRYTGKDWVLILLQSLNEDMREKVMFMWWRTWHHRNDCIFRKGDASYSHSASFLKHYLESMQLIKSGNIDIDRKGKKTAQPLETIQGKAPSVKKVTPWIRPMEGWIKVNVDASFHDNQKSGTCYQGLKLAIEGKNYLLCMEQNWALSDSTAR
jgi:hypothetical protein